MPAERLVPHGVHPSVKGVELSALAADPEGLAAQPELHQLMARDHAVLARRELGEGSVDPSSAWFGPDTGLNHALGIHAIRIAALPSQISTAP